MNLISKLILSTLGMLCASCMELTIFNVLIWHALVGKCPVREMPFGDVSVRDLSLEKCQSGNCSVGGGTVRIPFKKAWTTLRGYFFVNIFFITRKLITMTHSSVAKSLSRNWIRRLYPAIMQLRKTKNIAKQQTCLKYRRKCFIYPF